MSTRTFLLTGLVVALLIAGVGSFYASGHADGLEYVAQQAGFVDRAQDSPADDGPFAGYSTKGVEDARLGGGLAGAAGSLLVLTVAFGLFWTLRRRDGSDEPAESQG
jgi:cobalt/nickel transport protein